MTGSLQNLMFYLTSSICYMLNILRLITMCADWGRADLDKPISLPYVLDLWDKICVIEAEHTISTHREVLQQCRTKLKLLSKS